MHRSTQDSPLRPLAATPLPRLGILGGGQLAKMTAAAAAQFGCEVVVLERQEDFPAHSLDTHAIVGDWNDPAQVVQLASLVDVVTLENELVSVAALAALDDHEHLLFPPASTVAIVQDKLGQKQVFARAGLPVARFGPAPTRESVLAFGLPAVLKRRMNSYDGKGNATVLTAADLPAAWDKLDGDRNALYVEELCDFAMELAIILTRGRDGGVALYPLVETVNREHICHVVRAPVAVPDETARAAAEIAERAVVAIEGVGTFGMEFFLLRDGRLLVNEIAPRVHNTGHYTIEGCVTSQFENHVRAVLGWPLGSTRMRAPAAAMVNLLGYGEGSGVPKGLAEALRVPGAHVHVYGKTRSARGRKMGHVTALGDSLEEACRVAQTAADHIVFGGEG